MVRLGSTAQNLEEADSKHHFDQESLLQKEPYGESVSMGIKLTNHTDKGPCMEKKFDPIHSDQTKFKTEPGTKGS